MEDNYMALMLSKLKLTMGCTDVGAVAYAAATASSVIQGEICDISILLSPMIYKNALHVSIPFIKRKGIKYAGIFGALLCNPEKKLAVLDDMSQEILDKYGKIKDEVLVKVNYIESNSPLYIEVECTKIMDGEKNVGKVIISDNYDGIKTIYKNMEMIYNKDINYKKEEEKLNLNIEGIFQYISNMTLEDVNKLFPHEEINIKTSGKTSIRKNSKTNFKICDVSFESGEWVFQASKKRMSGESVSVISLCGSGNLGITTLLPVSCVASFLRTSNLERGRALALSILTAIYIKNKLNIVTTICGSALAGGCGVSAAVSYLYGGNLENIKSAINTIITTVFGILCDGAKESCSFKVSSAARDAVIIGYNSVKGIYTKEKEGIIFKNLEDTVNVISKFNNISMVPLEKMILEEIKNNE